MKILGFDYELKYGGTEKELDAWGVFDLKNQTIKIANDLSPAQEISTILHENLEVITRHCGIKAAHGELCTLETCLFTVLTENGVDLSPLRRELE